MKKILALFLAIWPICTIAAPQSLLWDPGMKQGCYVTNLGVVKAQIGQDSWANAIFGPSLCNRNVDADNIWKYAYLMSGTVENAPTGYGSLQADYRWPQAQGYNFGTAHYGEFYKDGNAYNFDWIRESDGWSVQQAVDKINFSNATYVANGFAENYVGTFFNTPLQTTAFAGDNIHQKFAIRLYAIEQHVGAHPDVVRKDNLGAARLTAGIVVHTPPNDQFPAADYPNGYTWYLETNLNRTSNFRDCTGDNYVEHVGPPYTCDPHDSNWYDRRSKGADFEVIYLNGAHLRDSVGVADVTIPVGGDYASVDLDITRMLSLAPWFKFPTGYPSAQIVGSYIGVELSGEARIWWAMKGYDLTHDQ